MRGTPALALFRSQAKKSIPRAFAFGATSSITLNFPYAVERKSLRIVFWKYFAS